MFPHRNLIPPSRDPSAPTFEVSQITNLPSTPPVLTLVTVPSLPYSYGLILVMVFRCIVVSSVPPLPPGELPEGTFRVPRVSASLNVLKAALLRRPVPTRLGVDAVDLLTDGSSKDPTVFQPFWFPWNKTGWQSWPAAIKASSAVQVKVT